MAPASGLTLNFGSLDRIARMAAGLVLLVITALVLGGV
jgi:hypothetical protein